MGWDRGGVACVWRGIRADPPSPAGRVALQCVQQMLTLLQRHADMLARDRGLLFGCALTSADLLIAHAARRERSRVRALLPQSAAAAWGHIRAFLAPPAQLGCDLLCMPLLGAARCAAGARAVLCG